MRRVEIITIGDELLIGQVVDTNSAWMGQELSKLGLDVVRRTTVGDDEPMMLQAFERAMAENDVVLLTGGLGPTKDDITKQALCRFFNTDLEFNQEVFDTITAFFAGRSIPINSLNRSQAMVPKAAEVIRNRWGTAPVSWFERNGVILVSMPGVPYEMKGVMNDEILPRLRSRFEGSSTILHHTYCVKNFPESVLAEYLSEWESALPPSLRLAYLPSPGLIRLRLSGRSENQDALLHTMTLEGEKLRGLLGRNIYAERDLPLGQMIGQMLVDRGLSIAVAESCSGGCLSHMLTAESGASSYFRGGVVAYANEAKQTILSVDFLTLERYGAVSEETVVEMIKGVRHLFGTDCAIATTGVAGPTGGTDDKPVGTVWIAVSHGDTIRVERKRFGTVRENNMIRTAQTALLMLQELLIDTD